MTKRQWTHRAKAKAERNFDAKALDYLQVHFSMLNKPISTIREKKIRDPNFEAKKVHEADLVLNQEVFLHHDTIATHGELGVPDKKTLDRDADFERANRPYIIINADLAKWCGLDEGDLAEYLYYHELQKIKARNEANGFPL